MSLSLFFLKSFLMGPSSIVFAGKDTEHVLPLKPGVFFIFITIGRVRGRGSGRGRCGCLLDKVLRQVADISTVTEDHLHKFIHSVVHELVVTTATQAEHSDLLGFPVTLHHRGIEDEIIFSHLNGTIRGSGIAVGIKFDFGQLEVRPELVDSDRPGS